MYDLNAVTMAQEKVESWKRDHEEAQEVMDLEEALWNGLALHWFLTQLDLQWRIDVHAGKTEYDPEIHSAIQQLFEGWLTPCDAVEQRIQEFEGRRWKVDHAEEFRKTRSATEAACRDLRE